jgi:hypothetical protein
MKKLISAIFIYILLFICSIKSVYAIYDPTSVDNNKFGIHLGSPADLEEAASLVNSSNGDWVKEM